ncbi:unnamed protein product [Caenorhabditis angaria]|uniref:PLAT domain-containing protein n=1 Tax=Caenorhabditis angaria TaxID=860376 RepID=A0A9P1IQU8_9PELO|nr:unnamed protein product [Caenorhabditis angaria]
MGSSELDTTTTTTRTPSIMADEDDSPAAFSVVIGTSSESTEKQNGLISILIRDVDGYCTDRTLLRQSHSHFTPFMRGHSDLFVIANQPSLGPLESAEIYYNPSDELSETPWRLRSLQILHHESGKIYNFQLDSKLSTQHVMTMVCKEDAVQIIPMSLPNPFK